MKSRWFTVLVAFLIPLLLAGAYFYNMRSCNGGAFNGTAVWVPHLNMCAATASEESDHLVLDLDTVCGTQEWDCQYLYRSPVTGKPLDLPDFVNSNFTPISDPVTLSPDLKNLIYMQRSEAEAQVHVYDLVNEVDREVASFGFEISFVSNFEWVGADQFSFVTMNYNADEPKDFTAERHLYEWHEGMWDLILREFVQGGEVECNPIYCELK